jgi:hypothetical protein
VFWSGLRSIHTGQIVCSIIGFYTISCVLNASEVGPLANPAKSGRLWKHIPIGSFRDRAQRVDKQLQSAWGGLQNQSGQDWQDGYIQLSGAPPIFRHPAKFLKWFWAHKPKLVHANNV